MYTAKRGGDYIQIDKEAGKWCTADRGTRFILGRSSLQVINIRGRRKQLETSSVYTINICTWTERDFTVLLRLPMNRKALTCSSGSEALESLAWPAHVNSTRSHRTSHVTWNPFSGCSDILYQRLRDFFFSNEYSGSSSDPARVHAHSYGQQARRRWPGFHQTSFTNSGTKVSESGPSHTLVFILLVFFPSDLKT